MKPTDIKDKDSLIEYLHATIEEKDKRIETLYEQIAMLMKKLADKS